MKGSISPFKDSYSYGLFSSSSSSYSFESSSLSNYEDRFGFSSGSGISSLGLINWIRELLSESPSSRFLLILCWSY